MLRTIYPKTFDLKLYLRCPPLAHALKALAGRSPETLTRDEQIDVYVAMQPETHDPETRETVRAYHARCAARFGAELPRLIARSIQAMATSVDLVLEVERVRAHTSSTTTAASAAEDRGPMDEAIAALKKTAEDPEQPEEERARARKALKALGVEQAPAPKGRKASGSGKAPEEGVVDHEKQAIAALSAIGSGRAIGHSEDERYRAREALRRGYGLTVDVVAHASVDGTRQSMHPRRSAAEIAEDDWNRRYPRGGR